VFGASESTLAAKEQCSQDGCGLCCRLCAGELIDRLEMPRNDSQCGCSDGMISALSQGDINHPGGPPGQIDRRQTSHPDCRAVLIQIDARTSLNIGSRYSRNATAGRAPARQLRGLQRFAAARAAVLPTAEVLER
jgi:hypothetical protein